MSATLIMPRPVPAGLRRPGRRVLSALGGAGFTLVLFSAIARFEKTPLVKQQTEPDDLRAVSLPLEPPPPPRVVPPPPAEVVATVTGFEATPSASPVKIAATPPDLDDILAPPPVAPPAMIQVGNLHAEFKPRIDLTVNTGRIYQAAEVDQLPRVIYRDVPRVSERVRNNAKSLRVTFLVLIDAEGVIKDVQFASSSGNPQFDAIMTKSIKDWSFEPAVRKGKNVKCLLEQEITVVWRAGSLFGN